MAVNPIETGQGSRYKIVYRDLREPREVRGGSGSVFTEDNSLGSSTVLSLNEGPVAFFKGRTRLYTIRVIRSGSEHGFVAKIDNDHFQLIPEFTPVVEIVHFLNRHVYPERARRNPELTTKRVLNSLSHPRTILEVALYEGIPVGYGIFPRLDADRESLVYSSRAIVAEHVQEGLGTYMLEQAILRHKKEAVRWNRPLEELFLMTQRWESIKTLKVLQGRGLIETIQPIDEPYDERGLRLLYVVHSQVCLNSTGIDQTGRSAGELSEVGHNENFTRPDPEKNPEGAELFDKITKSPPKGAGVNPFNGDELYVRGILAKSLPPVGGEISSGKII